MSISFLTIVMGVCVALAAVAAHKIDQRSNRPYAPSSFLWLAVVGLGMSVFSKFLARVGFEGWMWLAWVVAAGVLVFVTLKVARLAVAIVALGALVLTGLGMVSVLMAPAPSATTSQTTNTGGAQAQAAAPAGTGTSPATCPAQFVQKWDPNRSYNFASDGLYTDPVAKTVSPEGGSAKLEELAGQDVRALDGYARSDLRRDANNIGPLMTIDKTCLSVEGIALYEQLVQKWHSGKTTIGLASATSFNSGIDNTAFVVSATPGISGDLTALVHTYADGTQSDYLVRCANPALPGVAASTLPVGRTDQTPQAVPQQPGTAAVPQVAPTTNQVIPPPPATTIITVLPTTTPVVTTTVPLPPTTTTVPLPPTTTTVPPPPTTTTVPPTTTPTKNPADNFPPPVSKSSVPAPVGPPELHASVESHPAKPDTKPNAPAPTHLQATGATPEPTQQSKPAPLPTVVSKPSAPGANIPNDPNGGSSNTLMGIVAPVALIGGWGLRRRIRQ